MRALIMIRHHLVPPWTTYYGPRRPRPLLLALMLSLGIHAAALLLPDWLLPSAEPWLNGSPVSVFEARLQPTLDSHSLVNESVFSPAQDTAPIPYRSNTKRTQMDQITQPRAPALGAVSAPSPTPAARSMQVNAGDSADPPHASELPAYSGGAGVNDLQASFNHGDAAALSETATASTPVAYLSNPKPNYPEMARREEQEGMVVLRVLVAKDGSPAEIKIRKSSGFRTLDGAAVAGVKHWSFTPARQNQQSVDAWMDIPIRFRLNKNGD